MLLPRTSDGMLGAVKFDGWVPGTVDRTDIVQLGAFAIMHYRRSQALLCM